MAMGDFLNAGYKGIALIDGSEFRFSDASIVAKQAVEAPDLVMGDIDRDAYVFGKIEIGGSINGPVTETFMASGGVFDWACGREACGGLASKDVELIYYCEKSRNFTGLMVNSLNFSVAAGDIAQFGLELIGTDFDAWGTNTADFTTPEKLITWDKINIGITKTGTEPDAPAQAILDALAYSNFDFTVANNIEAQYSLGQADLKPYDLVPGLRNISGSITIFNIEDFGGADTFDSYCADQVHTINLNIEGGSCVFTDDKDVSMKVRFSRIEPSLSAGIITSTVAFQGVTDQTAAIWNI